MTEMAGVETVTLEAHDLEFDIPCDWGENVWHPHGSAQWIARGEACHFCGDGGGDVHLFCVNCYYSILNGVDFAVECDQCGGVWTPARHAFRSFEKL